MCVRVFVFVLCFVFAFCVLWLDLCFGVSIVYSFFTSFFAVLVSVSSSMCVFCVLCFCCLVLLFFF